MAKMKKLRKARLDRVVEEIDLADEDGEIVCVCVCIKDKMLAVYD